MGNGQLISENMGLRVIGVQNGSPGEQAGLIPYMDFIITVEKHKLLSLLEFQSIIKENEDKTLIFEIYNAYKQRSRFQQIHLTRNWVNSDGLLGIKVRVENFFIALEQTYKILKVNSTENSLTEGEYLLGSPNIIIESFDDFQLALTKTNRQEMGVYNPETKQLRQIVLKCGRGVGIGCQVGQGKIHELKISEDECITISKIIEFIEEEVQQESVEDVHQLKEENKTEMPIVFEKPAIPETQMNVLQAKRARKGSSQRVFKNPFQLYNDNFENQNKKRDQPMLEKKENEDKPNKNKVEKEIDTKILEENKEKNINDEIENQTIKQPQQQDSDSSSDQIIQLDSDKEESSDQEEAMQFFCEKYQRNYIIKQNDLFELNIELLNEY